MITLKHLAREYDIPNLYKLRAFLRNHIGIRRRWRWDPQTETQELNEVRKLIEEHYGQS